MAIPDLNQWLDMIESEGELVRIKDKVDWDLEIGGIAQEAADRGGPAVLFENIKDHENTLCKRFFTGAVATYPRIALMLGLPKDTPYKELIKVWRERSKKLIKPKIVNTGPVKQNILMGEDVDLGQFPAPKWHERDGHRYIGTFDGVITKDRDSDWMNVGNYRRAVHNKNQMGIAFVIGQHIWMHWRSYRKKGENVPVAVAVGWNPLMPSVSCSHVPVGVCEYDVMGGLAGEPVELVKCETNDLLVPARHRSCSRASWTPTSTTSSRRGRSASTQATTAPFRIPGRCSTSSASPIATTRSWWAHRKACRFSRITASARCTIPPRSSTCSRSG